MHMGQQRLVSARLVHSSHAYAPFPPPWTVGTPDLVVERAVRQWVQLLTRDEGDPGDVEVGESEGRACILGIGHLHACQAWSEA